MRFLHKFRIITFWNLNNKEPTSYCFLQIQLIVHCCTAISDDLDDSVPSNILRRQISPLARSFSAARTIIDTIDDDIYVAAAQTKSQSTVQAPSNNRIKQSGDQTNGYYYADNSGQYIHDNRGAYVPDNRGLYVHIPGPDGLHNNINIV